MDIGNCDLDGVPRKVSLKISGLRWDLKHREVGGVNIHPSEGTEGAKPSVWVSRMPLRHWSRKLGGWYVDEAGEAEARRISIKDTHEIRSQRKDEEVWAGRYHEKSVNLRQVVRDLSWETVGWKSPGFFHLYQCFWGKGNHCYHLKKEKVILEFLCVSFEYKS